MFKNCLNVIVAETKDRDEIQKIIFGSKTLLRGKYGWLCEGKRVIVVAFHRREVVYSSAGGHATQK